jgi:hypothetical protein
MASTTNQHAITATKTASLLVGFLDQLDFTAIFSMFFKSFLHVFLEEIGKYFLFPIAAGATIIQASLLWYQTYLEGGNKRTMARALLETFAAVAVTVAVVGGLVFATTFALATPIIFAATLALKTLFHAASTFYFLGKWSNAVTDKKKQEYMKLAKDNGVAAVAGIIATAAVVTVFIFGKFALGALGVGAGVLGAGFTLYKGISMYKESRKNHTAINLEEVKSADSKPELTSSAKVFGKVGKWVRFNNKPTTRASAPGPSASSDQLSLIQAEPLPQPRRRQR